MNWQQRIAAMEPWGYDDAGNPLCVFCEVNRYKVVRDSAGRLLENKHESGCLWHATARKRRMSPSETPF